MRTLKTILFLITLSASAMLAGCADESRDIRPVSEITETYPVEAAAATEGGNGNIIREE